MTTAQQVLLQALGGDPDGSIDPDAVLGELAGNDPALALLATLLLEGRASDDHHPSGRPDADVEELEELRQRNEVLAAALGACFACWGADVFCTHCGGAGRPGAAAPEPRLFRQLVAPAVARLGDLGGATPKEGEQGE